MGISRYLNRLSVQPFKPRYFAVQTWVETIQGSGSTFRSWSVGQDCRQGAHSLDIFGSVITVMKHWEMASWLQGETPKCQWWQEDEFLSRVVRSMGSHLSHDRAKELGMMEVPDMATVPWKVNDIVFWIAGIWGFFLESEWKVIFCRIYIIYSPNNGINLIWIWHGLGVLEICSTGKLHGSGRAGIPGGFWREDRCIRCIQQTSTAGVKKKGSFVGAIVAGNSSPVWGLRAVTQLGFGSSSKPTRFRGWDVHRCSQKSSYYKSLLMSMFLDVK